MKNCRIVSIIALSMIASLFSCKQRQAANEEINADEWVVRITKEQFNHINMQTGALQEVVFNDVIEVRGIADVQPQNRAAISPVVSGSVKEIFVKPSARVRKGQALLSFEGPEIIGLQQSYLEVSEQIKSLQAEYERQKALFAESVASEKLFLEAESNYKKTMAVCEGLRQQLLLLNMDIEKIKQGKITSFAVICSPIAGDIIRINADISRFIQPSDVVAEIIDTQQLQLFLSVFEKDVVSIHPGQKVIFSLPESSTQTFDAAVSIVGRAIDPTNRTAVVQARPTNDVQAVLLSGMYIDAGIVTASKSVWALPMDALITEEEGYFVLLLQSSDDREYIFQKMKVQTGKRNGDYMEIIPDNNTACTSLVGRACTTAVRFARSMALPTILTTASNVWVDDSGSEKSTFCPGVMETTSFSKTDKKS